MNLSEAYLKGILATVARQTFPPAVLRDLVVSSKAGAKQIKAYNLCDGEHSQSQIAAESGIDNSNLRKSISRWVELGIVIRTNDNGEVKPVHVYPLLVGQTDKKKGKRSGG